MIYLYGLMDPDLPAPVIAPGGVTGAVHCHSLPAGHLIYGPHDGGEILAKRRYLLAHTKILEDLARQGTVLPMRFGMLAEDLDSVAALVSAQAEGIAVHLDRLRDQLEFGLRVAYPQQAVLSHQVTRDPRLKRERDRLRLRGRHFENAEFGRKLGDAVDAHRTDLQRKFLSRIKPLVSDLVLRAPESQFQVLHATVLLPKCDAASFPKALEQIVTEQDFAPDAEPEVRLVGPAPLYNFVHLNLGQTAEAA